MSAQRPFLHSSFSFSAPAPSLDVIAERPLNRRLWSVEGLPTMTVPTPAAFEPGPLPPRHPQIIGVRTASTSFSSRNAAAAASLTMDPSPQDPTALFIHPPFNDFPNMSRHPDGLTYAVMAENPEWFLDARDYNSPTNDNPNAIPYPSQLEPPRGWCPSKKKEMKELGPDGWPEGEEPRLRCTFCRRTYAGVNAKSMWRRHVYEKHKIAMANRRDGTERVRGRNSNKENKKSATPSASQWENAPSLHSAPQASTSKSGSMQPPFLHPSQDSEATTPTEGNGPVFVPDGPVLSQPGRKVNTPPQTPQSSRIARMSEPVLAISTPTGLQPASSTPFRKPPIPEASPYNPNVTPNFRHDPPRLPSDQPWRFPSPTHPLHSGADKLTLCSAVRGDKSPSTPAGGLNFSPVVLGGYGSKKTPGDSPSIGIFAMRQRAQDLGIFATSGLSRTPFRGLFSGGEHTPFRTILSAKPTPRRLFTSTSTARSSDRSFGSDLSGDSNYFSDINDSWSTEGSSGVLEPPIDLEHDPLSLLDPAMQLALQNQDQDSPVIRRTFTLSSNMSRVGSSLGHCVVGSSDVEDDEDDEELLRELEAPVGSVTSSDEGNGKKRTAPLGTKAVAKDHADSDEDDPPARAAKRRRLSC